MFIDVQNVLIHRDQDDNYCLVVNNPKIPPSDGYFVCKIIDTNIEEYEVFIGKDVLMVAEAFSYFDYINE